LDCPPAEVGRQTSILLASGLCPVSARRHLNELPDDLGAHQLRVDTADAVFKARVELRRGG
jgi:hypothetical protein